MEAKSLARSRPLVLPGSRRLLAAFSDDRLVAAVRAGNERAFEVLYDRHHRGVLGFCRHMLGSADEAEDAVQQSFLSAHGDLLRDPAKPIRFKPWLYTIARNRCLSILRARREQSSEEIEVSVDRLSDDVAQRADLRDLLRDLSQLPDRQRAALVLSELADLSHAEVAEVVQCEASQVKSLVFQARSSLIDRRQARETPCEEIREQLSTLRGGALRRSHLRLHLKDCPGCTVFRDDLRRQRQMLAVALPVIPSLGLKESVLSSLGVGVGGGAGGAGIAAGVAAKGGAGLAAKGLVAKAAVVAVVAGGAAGGGAAVIELRDGGGHGAQAGAAGAAAGQGDESSSGRNGFTPVKGEPNGARAREFAATRGRGKKQGLHMAARVKRARKLRAERSRRRAVARRRSQERTARVPRERADRDRTRPLAPTPQAVQPTSEPVPEPTPVPEPMTTEPAPQTTLPSGTEPPGGALKVR